MNEKEMRIQSLQAEYNELKAHFEECSRALERFNNIRNWLSTKMSSVLEELRKLES